MYVVVIEGIKNKSNVVGLSLKHPAHLARRDKFFAVSEKRG
jgi:hypothetical protein